MYVHTLYVNVQACSNREQCTVNECILTTYVRYVPCGSLMRYKAEKLLIEGLFFLFLFFYKKRVTVGDILDRVKLKYACR